MCRSAICRDGELVFSSHGRSNDTHRAGLLYEQAATHCAAVGQFDRRQPVSDRLRDERNQRTCRLPGSGFAGLRSVMKRNLPLMLLLSVVASFASEALSEVVSDEKVKTLVIRSGEVIDNSWRARRMFDNAEGLCEGDTNRFARILCELAQTNDVSMADRMIGCLGWCGTSAQLPFLYSMATNEQHGTTAVKSILRLEGVTSNSLAAVDQCLSMTNVQARMERENLCLFMIDNFAKASTSNEIKDAVEERVLCFARRSGLYNGHFDSCLSLRMPGYQFSKRRLNVLRDAERSMIIRFNEAFITNAINELVAYPEANLPD